MVVEGMKDCAMVMARDSMFSREKIGCWEWAGQIPGVCVFGGMVWPLGCCRVLLSGGTPSAVWCCGVGGVGYWVWLELLGFCWTGLGAGLMEPLRGDWLSM